MSGMDEVGSMQLGRRILHVAVVAGLLSLAVLAGSAIHHGLEERAERARYPAPGRLLAVAGVRMHLDCRGQGEPTIVLEPGLVGDSLDWYPIHDRLAALTRTCAYDRAGLGWSDPAPGPRDSRTIASELAALLRVAGEDGPLLLVGHAMGGVHARVFQDRYPQRVVGLALLDASHEDGLSLLPEAVLALERRWLERDRRCAWRQPLGLVRLQGLMSAPQLPEAIRPAARALAERSHHCRERVRYAEALADDLRQAVSAEDLGALPLLVLTRGRAPTIHDLPPRVPLAPFREAFQIHQIMQRDHLRLSSNARQVVLPEAGHQLHWDAPERVVAELARLLQQVRSVGSAGPAAGSAGR